MKFDREELKRKALEIKKFPKKSKTPPAIEGKFKKNVSFKVVKKTLEEDEIKRITVDSIDKQIDEHFKNGLVLGKKLGFENLDNKITWKTGLLAIVTGIPSHGKSEFVDFVVTKLNIEHGWQAMYYTPENFPVPIHFNKISNKIIGRTTKIELPEYIYSKRYINDNYSWIYYDEKNTIEAILQTAEKYIVLNPKIKVLVIDPYNMVDTSMMQGETETLYINRLLNALEKFAKKYDVLVILVAHPKKMSREGNKILIPNLYDISGSAHFYNKADYGITVHRPQLEDGTLSFTSEIHIQKVRFNYLGSPGIVEMVYNLKNGRFSSHKENVAVDWDDSNWLDSVDIELDEDEEEED